MKVRAAAWGNALTEGGGGRNVLKQRESTQPGRSSPMNHSKMQRVVVISMRNTNEEFTIRRKELTDWCDESASVFEPRRHVSRWKTAGSGCPA